MLSGIQHSSTQRLFEHLVGRKKSLLVFVAYGSYKNANSGLKHLCTSALIHSQRVTFLLTQMHKNKVDDFEFILTNSQK